MQQRWNRSVLLLLCLAQCLVTDGFGQHARGMFLADGAPLGNAKDGNASADPSGFAIASESLEDRVLSLTDLSGLPLFLERDGVEVVDLAPVLESQGISEDNCDVSSRPVRLAVGKVLMEAVEKRFGRRAVHLADASRSQRASAYAEATVRDTRSSLPELRAQDEPRFFHADKAWAGIAELIDAASMKEALEATINADWPLISHELEDLSKEQLFQLLAKAEPGVLNIWASLTPGKLDQQPLAVLMNELESGSSIIARASAEGNITSVLSSVHMRQGHNDTISVLRSRVAKDTWLRWGYLPGMKFGEALLFFADRTPHGTVWLTRNDQEELPATRRVSAEMRLLVTDEAVGCPAGKSCDNVRVRRL